MTSGRKSKQKRPPAPAVAPSVPRRPSRRVLGVAAAAVVLVAVAVVLGVISRDGSSKESVPTNALPGAVEAQELLAGIPQQGNILGSPSAPVTMVEYIDLQCGYCRDFESHSLRQLIANYVRPGKVSLELRPLAGIGPDSARGRSAAIAAGRQNKLFNLTQILYANQGVENEGWLDDAMVKAAAGSIPGLDVEQLLEDINSADVATAAAAFDASKLENHITVTPTIFVGPRGETAHQVTLVSSVDENTVPAAIEAALP